MTKRKYTERLKEVIENIEAMLSFEKRALDKWAKPKNQEQADRQRDFIEPIVRTICAYETCLGYLEEYFPELREREER